VAPCRRIVHACSTAAARIAGKASLPGLLLAVTDSQGSMLRVGKENREAIGGCLGPLYPLWSSAMHENFVKCRTKHVLPPTCHEFTCARPSSRRSCIYSGNRDRIPKRKHA
jgi:hypothetical protein